MSVAIADVNRDGKPDLVVANSGSGDVTVLLGDGRGGFVPAAGSPHSALRIAPQRMAELTQAQWVDVCDHG